MQEAQSIVKLKENCDILTVDGVRPIKSIESKNVYQRSLWEKFVVPTSERKFEILFKKYNLQINWNNVYTCIYQTTIDPYLRQFQYKILHYYLATNEMLFKWNLND